MTRFHELKPQDLDPFKLKIIGLGSFCGFGLGILVGHLIDTSIIVYIISFITLIYGLSILVSQAATLTR